MVREAPEVVELLLKGALRFVGVDPPKRHDVRNAILRAMERFPSEARDELRELAEASSVLAQERSHAFYGDEEAMVGASELFKVEDGRRALILVDRVLSLYARLLGGS